MLIVLLAILVKKKKNTVFASYWSTDMMKENKSHVLKSDLHTSSIHHTNSQTTYSTLRLLQINRVHKQAFPVCFIVPLRYVFSLMHGMVILRGRKSRCLGLNNVEIFFFLNLINILQFCKTDCDIFDYYGNEYFSITIFYCLLKINK